MPLSPHPRRTITAGWIILALCFALQVLCTFLSAATYTLGVRYSPFDALAAASRTSIAAAAQSSGGWLAAFIIPAMAITWLVYARAATRERPHRRRIVYLSYALLNLAGICAGSLIGVLASPIVVLLGVAAAAAGRLGTSMYTSGVVCFYPVGIWIWFLIVVHELDARRPRQPAHLCQHCAYDRTGLNAAAPCPECGGYPTLELRRSRWR